jgi:membrane associated rhomboid family serine protease
MEYLLYSFLGLCLGLVLGIIGASIYTAHLYAAVVQADPVREDDMWGLVNFGNEVSGGAWGAFGGLITGVAAAWWRQRTQSERALKTAASQNADASAWPPPPDLL